MFFLDWREDENDNKQVGKAPREALDGWRNPTGWLLAASIASCWALFVASRPVLQAGRAASEPHLPCSSVHRVLANAASQSRKTSRHSETRLLSKLGADDHHSQPASACKLHLNSRGILPMESLTYASPRCIGEGVMASANSSGNKRYAEFKYGNFVASICE